MNSYMVMMIMIMMMIIIIIIIIIILPPEILKKTDFLVNIKPRIQRSIE